MKKIQFALIVLAIIILLLWIVTWFLPSRITMFRPVNIHVTAPQVDSQVSNFKNWKNWYPAFGDSSVDIIISERKDTFFASLINKKNNDTATLALVKLSTDSIKVLLPENDEEYLFIIKPMDNGETELTWFVNLNLEKHPWKKFGGMFFDKVNGSKYEAVLNNLKTYLETAH